MNNIHHARKPWQLQQPQKGFTLLEIIIALGIFAVVTVGIASLLQTYSDGMRTSIAGQQIKVFGNATQAYIKDNYSAITAVATATQPALINTTTLISTGYLQSGFEATNGFGQTVCALVLQNKPGRLAALVVAEGGTAINDMDLGQIAGTIGAAGGGIYSTTPTQFTGAVGGWGMPFDHFANANNMGMKCDGSSGTVSLAVGHNVMALWFADGDNSAAYLYRDEVPGHPELNTMNTPINMAAIRVYNASCTPDGAIAQDGKGLILSCREGKWRSQDTFWNDPVPSYGALPACDADNTGHTRVVESPSHGTGPRAFTCNGTEWLGLAVDDDGNMTISNIMTVETEAKIKALSGDLQVKSMGTDGAACVGEGRIAQSTQTSGAIVSCQGGIWKKTGGGEALFGGSYITYTLHANNESHSGNYGCVNANPITGACSCPAGYGGYLSGMSYNVIEWDWANVICYKKA